MLYGISLESKVVPSNIMRYDMVYGELILRSYFLMNLNEIAKVCF